LKIFRNPEPEFILILKVVQKKLGTEGTGVSEGLHNHRL
jgi:hypothetical protein